MEYNLETLWITISYTHNLHMGFLGGSVMKSPPAKQETWVWSLGQEDPLEKEIATHCSILVCKSHGKGSLAGYYLWGRWRVGHDLVSKHLHPLLCLGQDVILLLSSFLTVLARLDLCPPELCPLMLSCLSSPIAGNHLSSWASPGT